MIDAREAEARMRAIMEGQLPGMGPQLTDSRRAISAERFACERATWTMARAWNYYAAPRTDPWRLQVIDTAPFAVAIAVIEAAQVFNEGYLLLHATRVVPGGTHTPFGHALAYYEEVRDFLLATAEEAEAYLSLAYGVARSVGGRDTAIRSGAFARGATQAIRDSIPDE